MAITSLASAERGPVIDEFLDALTRPPNDARIEAIMSAICRLTGSDVVLHQLIGTGRDPVATIRLWPSDVGNERMSEEFLRAGVPPHPLLVHSLRTRRLDIVAVDQLCGRRGWRSSAAFDVVSSVFGVTEQVCIPLAFEAATFRSVVISRADREYGPRELDAALWIQRSMRLGASLDVRVDPRLGVACLSPRERQVMLALAGGRTRSAAARELGISPRTMDKHLENIFRRLGVSSLVGALSMTGFYSHGSSEGRDVTKALASSFT